jgi:hypothetical protein
VDYSVRVHKGRNFSAGGFGIPLGLHVYHYRSPSRDF